MFVIMFLARGGGYIGGCCGCRAVAYVHNITFTFSDKLFES